MPQRHAVRVGQGADDNGKGHVAAGCGEKTLKTQLFGEDESVMEAESHGNDGRGEGSCLAASARASLNYDQQQRRRRQMGDHADEDQCVIVKVEVEADAKRPRTRGRGGKAAGAGASGGGETAALSNDASEPLRAKREQDGGDKDEHKISLPAAACGEENCATDEGAAGQRSRSGANGGFGSESAQEGDRRDLSCPYDDTGSFD